MKKYLGGALLDQCMEEVQHWKVAQHDGDGYAALIKLLQCSP